MVAVVTPAPMVPTCNFFLDCNKTIQAERFSLLHTFLVFVLCLCGMCARYTQFPFWTIHLTKQFEHEGTSKKNIRKIHILFSWYVRERKKEKGYKKRKKHLSKALESNAKDNSKDNPLEVLQHE